MTHDVARYDLYLLITLYKGAVSDSITVLERGGWRATLFELEP